MIVLKFLILYFFFDKFENNNNNTFFRFDKKFYNFSSFKFSRNLNIVWITSKGNWFQKMEKPWKAIDFKSIEINIKTKKFKVSWCWHSLNFVCKSISDMCNTFEKIRVAIGNLYEQRGLQMWNYRNKLRRNCELTWIE